MAKQIESQISQTPNNLLKAKLYDHLYQLYKETGNSALALEKFELHQIYADSLQQEEDITAQIREGLMKQYEEKINKKKKEFDKTESSLKGNYLRNISILVLTGGLLFAFLLWRARKKKIEYEAKQQELLLELEQLKNADDKTTVFQPAKFELNRDKLENFIGKKLNETDWNVLNILLADPVMSNKDVSVAAYMSVDGIGSSLRRMYALFNTKDSKYKKISLIMDAIKISNAVGS